MRPLDLPPRHCPMCLVGACHRCTGRMVVLSGPREQRLDVPCEHVHRQCRDDEPTRRPIETVEIPGVSR